MSNCGKNCKCKKCSPKNLIVGRLKDAIREMVKNAIDEMSGTGGVAGFQTPYAFGNRGKDIGKSSMPGGKVAKDIDETKKKAKAKAKIVPVGKEKGPNVVITPTHPDRIDSADKVVIARRGKIAASKGDQEGVKLYKKLGGLAKKQGVK